MYVCMYVCMYVLVIERPKRDLRDRAATLYVCVCVHTYIHTYLHAFIRHMST